MSDDPYLAWATPPTPDALEVALAAFEWSGESCPRRVVVELDAPAGRGLRAILHRHGFRLEGVGRQARATASGHVDVLRYARLGTDPTGQREMFTAVMNTVTPRKRLISHALIADAAGRVLLCETSFKPDFELPGGIVEPGESPRAGLVRELTEEIGREVPVGGILVVDWLPPYLGWEDALEVIFDGGILDADAAASLVPDGAEIVALHWLEPEAAASRMTPIAGRHLLTALRTRSLGQTVYLEAGEAIDA